MRNCAACGRAADGGGNCGMNCQCPLCIQCAREIEEDERANDA